MRRAKPGGVMQKFRWCGVCEGATRKPTATYLLEEPRTIWEEFSKRKFRVSMTQG